MPQTDRLNLINPVTERLYSSIAHAAACACACLLTAAAMALPQVGPGSPVTGWIPGDELNVGIDTPEALNAGSRFGYAMSMNDTYAVVGAPDARLYDAEIEGFVNGAGAAYVFKRDGASWVFLQRLVAPKIVLSQMGSAVSIDPETSDIVVGAWAYNGRGVFSGAAFYFKKGTGDTWGVAETSSSLGNKTRMPTQNLIPADLVMIDEFGFSVAIRNGTIVAGTPLSGGSNAGAVYVYENVGDVWVQTQKLVDESGGANDQLGTRVALDGNLLVCGVQNDDVQGKVNAGSALIFKRNALGTPFALVTKLTAATPVSGAQFGASVAVRDGTGAQPDYIALGSPTLVTGSPTAAAGNGAVFMYRRSEGDLWVEDGTLLPRAVNINNNFGYSVAMTQTDPPEVLVGAPGYDTVVPGLVDPAELVQVVNAGTGFTLVRTDGAWDFRRVGDISTDLWTTDIRTLNTSIGRSVAIAPSAGNVALVGAETPSGSDGTVFGFTFALSVLGTEDGQVPGPVDGVLPSGGGGPGGGGGGLGSGGTGGGITGGGAPGTASDVGGGFTLPLLPIIQDWGVIKGTAVAIGGQRISALQTDGVHDGNVPKFKPVGTLPEGATFVGLGDMNGDNSGDVVYVTAGNVLKYWKRDEFIIREDITIDTLPAGYVVVAVADVNGDNKADIVLQDAVDSRAVTVWLMSGGGISSSTDYELPEGEWTIYVGPFASSSSNSILIRNAAEHDLRLLVDNNGAVSYRQLRDGGPRARLVGYGDLDSDGQPDLWWQSGGITVDFYDQQNDGNYKLRERMRTPISGGRVLSVRDWNGDGVVDTWIRSGRRNFVIYLTWDGHLHMDRARDIGDAPGRVVGFADR